jgi:hypothetical protein
MRNRFMFVPVALLACISQVAAQVAPVIGLAIINDGKRAEPASVAYEYAKLRMDSGTYQITLADGRKWSGLAGHVRKRIDYRVHPAQKALQDMVDCSNKYQNSAKILAPRIESMRKKLEEMKQEADLEAIPEKNQAAVMLDKLTYKGEKLTNIRVTSLQGGKLGFTHDSGNFAVPAMALNHAFLQQIKTKSPGFARKFDFENLMATFSDRLKVGDKEFTDVRLLAKDKDSWTIQTNSGNQKVAPAAIAEEAVAKLEANFQKTQRLTKRFDTAAREEDLIEADHIARAELAELRLARQKAEALQQHFDAIERERQIREEALRKAELARRERMQNGLGLFGAFIAALILADHFALPQAQGTDWNRFSSDVDKYCIRCSGSGGGFVYENTRDMTVWRDCPDCDTSRN